LPAPAWAEPAYASAVSTRLKIVVYAPTTSGGHAQYVAELVSELAVREDLEVVVASGIGAEPVAMAPTRVVGILPHMSPRGTYATRAWLADRMRIARRPERVFERWVRSDGADVVHLQEWTWWYLPLFVRRLARGNATRVVLTVHNVHPHERPGGVVGTWLHSGALRLGIRNAAAVIVHDEFNASLLRRRVGRRDHRKIFIAPHGVWSGKAATRDAAEPTAPVVLFFGVLRENKGIEDLLASLPHLPETVRLVIAGEAVSDKVERRINEVQQQFGADRVRRLAGYIEEPQVDELFGSAAVVALPYTGFAAQSGVLHLALAYACPVVVTDRGGMPEIVRKFGCGEVVPAHSPCQLAAAVASLMVPRANQRASRRAAAARDELTWRAAAEATAAVYRQCLEP
jgi:glycosyltransferase involved in cell wall biosynthesis